MKLRSRSIEYRDSIEILVTLGAITSSELNLQTSGLYKSAEAKEKSMEVVIRVQSSDDNSLSEKRAVFIRPKMFPALSLQ